MAAVDVPIPPPDSIPRLLVIDACNIARSSCGPEREAVNCAGLLNVIRWLTVRNFEVNAFVPIIYKNKHNHHVAHVFILDRLHELGIISFTPARTARCERPSLVNYDDLYVAQMAERHGGCVISGDRFHDILANERYRDLHPVLRQRLNLRFIPTPYPFVEVSFDRLYKKEPTFILERNDPNDLAQRLYAMKGSPFFRSCSQRRREFTDQKRERLLHTLDELMDELAEREAIQAIRLVPLEDQVPQVNEEHHEEEAVETIEELEEFDDGPYDAVGEIIDLGIESPMTSLSMVSSGGRSTSPPPPINRDRYIEDRANETVTATEDVSNLTSNDFTPSSYLASLTLPPLSELDLETMAELLEPEMLQELWLSPKLP